MCQYKVQCLGGRSVEPYSTGMSLFTGIIELNICGCCACCYLLWSSERWVLVLVLVLMRGSYENNLLRNGGLL
jgi:hypothetical protein